MMNLVTLVAYVILLLILVQIARLIFADADLMLMFKEKFGRKPEVVLYKQVIWITGASSGIGESLARELARCGAKLILSARRGDELERVKKQCLERGKMSDDDIMILPLDLMKYETHVPAVEQVLKKFGKIDILVNNAGRSQRAFIADTSLDVLQDLMAINYIGAISITKAVLPSMLARKQGHLVFNTSVTGLIAVPTSAGYVAAKHAVHGFCNSMRAELINENIDVTIVCPGPVESDGIPKCMTGTRGETYNENNETIKKMPTDRCAELFAYAIANKLNEAWISQNPWLLVVYLHRWVPALTEWFTEHFMLQIVLNIRKLIKTEF